MILNSDQFKKAADEVERIISLDNGINLKNELTQAAEGITDSRTRREFYRHMNTLFLNVLVNRLNEVGLVKEQRAIESRRIIVELINSI
jgi:hypothetical protein